VPRFTRKIDGQEAGEEGSSPARRTEVEKARIGRLNPVKVAAFYGGVPCGCSAFQERARVGTRAKCKRGGARCGCCSKEARSGERGRTWELEREQAGGFGTQQQRETVAGGG